MCFTCEKFLPKSKILTHSLFIVHGPYSVRMQCHFCLIMFCRDSLQNVFSALSSCIALNKRIMGEMQSRISFAGSLFAKTSAVRSADISYRFEFHYQNWGMPVLSLHMILLELEIELKVDFLSLKIDYLAFRVQVDSPVLQGVNLNP